MSNENEERHSRRRALQVIGLSVGAASTLLVACKSESKAPAAGKPAGKPAAAKPKPAGGDRCASVAPIDAQSAQMRKALQYVSESKTAGKRCDNCVQWEADKFKGECGGCKLFTGAVTPEGHCISWGPITPA